MYVVLFNVVKKRIRILDKNLPDRVLLRSRHLPHVTRRHPGVLNDVARSGSELLICGSRFSMGQAVVNTGAS